MKKLNPNPASLSLPSPDHAAAGDLMRVVCVYMVGWYHIWQQSWLTPYLKLGPFTLNLTAPVRAGYMFVDLLLLLSGFVTYLPYANGRETSARRFYLRRAARILPSYWLCLLVMLAIALAGPGSPDMARLGKDLAAHLTFTHNLFELSYTRTALNAVLWTLAVEVQFYLLLPLLAPAFRKHPLICYLGMTGAALCFQRLWTAGLSDMTLFFNRLPNMLDVYANGMLAAHLYSRLARVKERRLPVAVLGTLAAALGIWGALRVMGVQSRISGLDALRQGQLDHRWILTACGALFLAGGSLSFGPMRRACSNRAVRMLAALTFNFYIWHQWLAVRLKAWRIPPYLAESNPNQAGEMPWQMQYTLLCFAAALGLAAIVYWLVERPAARWMRGLDVSERNKARN